MGKSLEDDVIGFVGSKSEAQVRFVVDLCNVNSYTYNPKGTNLVAGMVLDEIGGVFASHEVIEHDEVGSHHILRTPASCASPPERSTYLIGHLDTVFPPDHPFQKCRLDGDWLRGPGTGDMKGGLAVMVYALKALQGSGLMDRLSLTLILGADEEIGSATSYRIYEREAERAAACLAAECAGPEGEFVISRSGKAGARLDCFGADTHIATVERRKSSAILEIAHKIIALEALNGSRPDVSVNVGRIEGGLGPATVPGQVSCLVDLRWSEEEDYESLMGEVRRVIQKIKQPECTCELELLNRRPAMPSNVGTRQMLALLTKAAAPLGITVKTEHRRGTSDANFFGTRGVPTIDGFGPICLADHTSDERVLVSSLAERTAMLALLLSAL